MHRYVFIFLIVYALFCVGGTYAYYAFQVEEESVITGNVIAIDVDLDVQLVVGRNTKMVPMLDAALSNAINGVGSDNGACIDSVGNLSCQVYKITLTNNGSRLKNLKGTVELYPKEGEGNSYYNLRWQELTTPTTIKTDSEIHRMAESVLVSDLTMESKEVKTWYIAVWLSDRNYDQLEIDKGIFGGTVTFGTGDFGTEELIGDAYAIYSEDDASLTFVRSSTPIAVGDTINNKAVTAVYTGFETDAYIVDDTGESTVPWNEYVSSIISVEVLNSVKPLSTAYWFSGMTNCISMNITKLNTSAVTDMKYMFYGCSSLTSLDVSSFDTIKVGINGSMANMFYNCSKLTSLDVSSFNTENITDISGMFYNCSNLIFLDVSGFDTSKVTNMSWMFSGCSKLKVLDVSGIDTSNVTGMAGMFYMCSGLTFLDVFGFDTSKVTNMKHMFDGCSSLTSLDVSGFETNNVTEMHYMFMSCSNLIFLDVSGFDTSKVTKMHYMFHLSGIKELDLSEWDTSQVTDMRSMFSKCDYLEKVTLGADFAWVGTDGYLPAPNKDYIPGATSKWYNTTTRVGYEPSAIPSNTVATYVAVLS